MRADEKLVWNGMHSKGTRKIFILIALILAALERFKRDNRSKSSLILESKTRKFSFDIYSKISKARVHDYEWKTGVEVGSHLPFH